MPLRLTSRVIHEGRKRWEPRGMAETDEDGHYRFACLMPGTYYLAAGPREGQIHGCRSPRADRRPDNTFPASAPAKR